MRARTAVLGTLSTIALIGLVLAIQSPPDAPGRAPVPQAAENGERDAAAPFAGTGVPTVPAPVTRQPPEGTTLQKATFAGGCFWCMEPPFDELEGVVSTISGYTGGRLANPSYEQVSSGGTGHLEAIQIEYDPEKVSYSKLLEVFWRNVDPTDSAGQFCDRGSQYQTAIFYHTEEQRRLAEESKRSIEESGRLPKPIVTPIRPASTFYPAEEYHQDYYKKNPLRYRFYRAGCGRDRVLRQLWGASAH